MNFSETMAIYDKHWDKTYPPGSADRIEQAEIANRVANVLVPLGLVVSTVDKATGKSIYAPNPMLPHAKALNIDYEKAGLNGSHIEELQTLAATLRSGVVEV